MVTDHSSAGFEFLLRDKPIVRIHRPALVELANIHRDYVNLLASVSDSVETAAGALRAVAGGLGDPTARSRDRSAAAGDLFYRPGGATARAVDALYELIELGAPRAADIRQSAQCQPSV